VIKEMGRSCQDEPCQHELFVKYTVEPAEMAAHVSVDTVLH
jgi:hypothetical protein